MRRNKIVSIVLAAALTVSQAVVPAFADTRADIAAAEASKNEAQSSLDEAQSNISSLQTEKTELETYLNELNTQLTQLSTDLSTINDSMIDKQVEIEITQVAVERARTDEQSQYNAMKNKSLRRIAAAQRRRCFAPCAARQERRGVLEDQFPNLFSVTSYGGQGIFSKRDTPKPSHASSIAFPISLRLYLFSNVTRSLAA